MTKPLQEKLNEAMHAYGACKYLGHVRGLVCEALFQNLNEMLLEVTILKAENNMKEDNSKLASLKMG